MRYKPFFPVILIAFSALSALPVAQARQAAAAGHGTSPSMMYTQAIQRLRSVHRLQFVDTVNVLQQDPRRVQEILQYVGPDRTHTLLQAQQGGKKVRSIETIQVSGTRCQRPPAWTCFHYARPSIVTLVKSLILPNLAKPKYSATSTTVRAGSAKHRAVAVHIEGTEKSATYAGSLVVDLSTKLPVSFSSDITTHGTLVAQQKAVFTYGGTFAIQLPRGKNVHLPPP